MNLESVLVGIITLVVGLAVGYFLFKKKNDADNSKLKSIAEDIISKAKREGDEIIKEAKLESKDIVYKGRLELEKDVKEKKRELSHAERRLDAREESLDKKLDSVNKKEELLSRKEQEYDSKLKDLDVLKVKNEEIKQNLIHEVERVASMTGEEAKRMLMEQMLDEAKIDSAKKIRELEEETKNEADKKARSIISTAIQRCASEFTNEITVSIVNIPNDEMKGRIIGREGRNIRTFENITGVDIIVDDTPEAVILSSYDPFRRETAKLTLEKLIADGRIHPARIEELHNKSRQEMDKYIQELGEETVFNLGIHNMSQEILKLVGRLKYRTSYGQNVLGHSIEVATIAGIMASELGLDPKMAKRAGLLHDIGKAIDYDTEGSHVEIGYEIAKKNKEDWRVLNAIMSHHGDEEFKCIEAVLVQASDAISASRPGARREILETYIKRLEKLEDVASSFEGVAKSFAVQAGREIRIIVEPDKVTDDGLIVLSRDISKKVEEELTYPGQIKVMVIRESRAIEFAK